MKFIVALTVFSITLATPVFSQDDYGKKLVGTWKCDLASAVANGDLATGISNYHSDGKVTTVVAVGPIKGQNFPFMTMFFQSPWSVRDGILLEGQLDNFKIMSASARGKAIVGSELVELTKNFESDLKKEALTNKGHQILHVGTQDLILKSMNDGEIMNCSRLR